MIIKNEKKLILTVFLGIVLSVLLFIPIFKNVYAGVIYEEKNISGIGPETTLTNIKRFTSDGWLNINVVTAKVSDPLLEIKPLISSSGMQYGDKVSNMAVMNDALAAINANFFNWTSSSGTVDPIGTIIFDGNPLNASSYLNKSTSKMATLGIDYTGVAAITYFSTDISLISNKGKIITVDRYNSYPNYDKVVYIDSYFSNISMGSKNGYMEVLVENSIIKEIRENMPAVSINENQAVILIKNSYKEEFKNNFSISERVTLQIKSSPDFSTIQSAVSGSCMLVENGRIPIEFSDNIAGRHPRTALGYTKDGNTLFLVTVDGRQDASIGMTQTELAEFLLELGAYNAMNLDGGGSTVMAARLSGSSSIDVVNSPSDGMERRVPVGIGIVSNAPKCELSKLILETSDTNIFKGSSREFFVKGLDKYFNNIAVEAEDIKWEVSGIEGYFKGSVFYPLSKGKGIIRAVCGQAEGQISINVLDIPAYLDTKEVNLRLYEGDAKEISITGVDKNGFCAYINPKDITWEIKGTSGSLDNGIFTALTQGAGYITASFSDIRLTISLSVASNFGYMSETFENKKFEFASYPEDIKGSAELSNDIKYSGNFSAKLSYEFTKQQRTEAAYLVFPNSGVFLGQNTTKIGLWVYNENENPNSLHAMIVDSNNEYRYVPVLSTIDFTGWKYIELDFDSLDFSPVILKRLYIVKTHDRPSTGNIYFDELRIYASGFPEVIPSFIPKSTFAPDLSEQLIIYDPDENSFRFSVFYLQRDFAMPIETILTKKLADKINMYIDEAIFLGPKGNYAAKSITKPCLSPKDGYISKDIMTSRFIQLNLENGSLLNQKGQWEWFLSMLESFSNDNIFIFLSDNLDVIDNSLEKDLFKQKLTEYSYSCKNIWVMYPSSENSVIMENNIKYISLCGFDDIDTAVSIKDAGEYINTALYLLVTVQDGIPTYKFKPIVP